MQELGAQDSKVGDEALLVLLAQVEGILVTQKRLLVMGSAELPPAVSEKSFLSPWCCHNSSGLPLGRPSALLAEQLQSLWHLLPALPDTKLVQTTEMGVGEMVLKAGGCQQPASFLGVRVWESRADIRQEP